MGRVIAEALYGAISSNAQSFKGAITKKRDIDCAEWLAAEYQIKQDMIYQQYHARTEHLADDIKKLFTPKAL